MNSESIKQAKLAPDRIDQLHKLAETFRDAGFFRNCLNCLEWIEPTPQAPHLNTGCMKFKQLPPPRILVTGCDQHTDLIPF